MRFLYPVKLALVLVTIVVALVVVGQAEADQSAGPSAPSTPVSEPQTPTAPSASPPATTPGLASAATTASSPAATNPSVATSTAVDASTPPATVSAPPATPTVTTTTTSSSDGSDGSGSTTATTPPSGTSASPSGTSTPPSGPAPVVSGPAPGTEPQPADSPAEPQPSNAPSSPTPVVSTITTQTITQIQISGCTSDCQGLSQAQTAQQQSVTVEIVPGQAQLAGSALAQGGSGSAPQSTSTITQIQLGCVTQCFDDTASNPATAAVSEQILADLSELFAGPDSSVPTPIAAGQTVTTQVSCQLQDGGSTTVAQVQSATESSTTLQLPGITPTLAAVIESALEGAPALAAPTSQTAQGTWQLQIGCLFYCVDSVQVQEASQSSTTVEVTAGASTGPDTGLVDVVTQTIWQVQIGCLSYCYDTTQLQEAASESTFVVLAPAPPPPPAPDPPAATDSSSAAPPPAESSPPTPGPVSPPDSTTPAVVAVAVQPVRVDFPTSVGRSVFAVSEFRRGESLFPTTGQLPRTASVERWRALDPLAPTAFLVARVGHAGEPPAHLASPIVGHENHPPVALLAARATAPGAGHGVPGALVALLLVVAFSACAILGLKALATRDR